MTRGTIVVLSMFIGGVILGITALNYRVFLPPTPTTTQATTTQSSGGK